MNTDLMNYKNEIEHKVERNLGTDTGWIKIGETYLANRDLASVTFSIDSFVSKVENW